MIRIRKVFENNNSLIRVYWVVPSKYFGLALEELGAPEFVHISKFEDEEFYKKNDKVFVYKDDDGEWKWNWFNRENIIFFKRMNYKYMGKIDFDEEKKSIYLSSKTFGI